MVALYCGRMRVLTVANHLRGRGGLERTQLTICTALASRGHDVDLIFVSEGDFAEEWRRFTRTMVQIAGTLPRRAERCWGRRWRWRRHCARQRLAPDVIYVFRYWDIPFAVALAQVTGAPVVFHLCLPPPKQFPRWLRAGLGRVAVTLAVSRDTAARWAGSGLAAKDIDVVLTGIDVDRYRACSR